MIPRLYSKTETAFETYGICPLIDALECTVTEERNGEFVLDMVYAKEGRFVEEITADRQILADPYEGAEKPEPFRIVNVEYDMDENLVIYAEHTSYQLNYIIVGKVSKNTRYAQAAMTNIVRDALLSAACPFEFYSDIGEETSEVKTVATKSAMSMRSVIAGTEGSILDTYGGELKWERYKVSLLKARGSNNGVRIAYGKNLTAFKYEIDTSNAITGVIAYYASGNTYLESVLKTKANIFGYSHDVAIDVSGDYSSTAPTQTQLNNKAQSYLNKYSTEPDISIDIDFVLLWQLGGMEYLEHVNLCDTIEIIYPPLNLKTTAKVVKTIYNVLEDRYDSITVSTSKKKITDTIYELMKKG